MFEHGLHHLSHRIRDAILPSFSSVCTLCLLYASVRHMTHKESASLLRHRPKHFILYVMIERNIAPVKGLFFRLIWLYRLVEGMSSPQVHEFSGLRCLRGCANTSIIRGSSIKYTLSLSVWHLSKRKKKLIGVYRVSCCDYARGCLGTPESMGGNL